MHCEVGVAPVSSDHSIGIDAIGLDTVDSPWNVDGRHGAFSVPEECVRIAVPD